TTAEPVQDPNQEKINEYINIAEHGTTMSSWIEKILQDGQVIIGKFTLLYQGITKENKELQEVAGSLSEELDNAKLQQGTFQIMIDCSANDMLEVGVINHPWAHYKALIALDYQVDQMEFILERINKFKEEALEAQHNMEKIVSKMYPRLLSASYELREADDTFQRFKAILSQGLAQEVTFDWESINNLLACRDFIGFLIEANREFTDFPDKLKNEKETCEVIHDHFKGPDQYQLQKIFSKFTEYQVQCHIESPEPKKDTP
ncbi:hypothetical protein KI387_003433, partial [Taxus chinensis]